MPTCCGREQWTNCWAALWTANKGVSVWWPYPIICRYRKNLINTTFRKCNHVPNTCRTRNGTSCLAIIHCKTVYATYMLTYVDNIWISSQHNKFDTSPFSATCLWSKSPSSQPQPFGFHCSQGAQRRATKESRCFCAIILFTTFFIDLWHKRYAEVYFF